MKKLALRGFILVLAVLIACFLLSGTIKTLTTAKAVFLTPKQGKLKEQIPLTAFLTFSETENIVMSDIPGGINYRIQKVNVSKGSLVHTGDVLLVMEPVGLSSAIKSQQEEYQTAQKELLALEKQYSALQFTRADQNWLDAYDGLLFAKAEYTEAKLALDAFAAQHGISFVDGKLPASTKDEALLEIQKTVEQKELSVQRAQTFMDKAMRGGISDEAYQYTMQRREWESRMRRAYDTLVRLHMLNENGNTVVAGHDGVVLGVQVTEGMTWDGAGIAVVINAEEADCVLRAVIPKKTRPVEAGTMVMLSAKDGSEIKTCVASVGYDEKGQCYADVPLSISEMDSLGTVCGLMDEGICMSLLYAAQKNTLLIPTSAVRGNQQNRFVYTAREEQNAFGQTMYIVEECSITVLDETSEFVSVEAAGNMGKIVYMEDRRITVGSEVIPYE